MEHSPDRADGMPQPVMHIELGDGTVFDVSPGMATVVEYAVSSLYDHVELILGADVKGEPVTSYVFCDADDYADMKDFMIANGYECDDSQRHPVFNIAMAYVRWAAESRCNDAARLSRSQKRRLAVVKQRHLDEQAVLAAKREAQEWKHIGFIRYLVHERRMLGGRGDGAA